MLIIPSLPSRSRSYAVVNAIERCGKPDMVFHAVLRYPSVRNHIWDRNIPVRKLSMALLWAGWYLGNCYENEEKNLTPPFSGWSQIDARGCHYW